MGNASDEEQTAVVEQVDAPDIATSSQMTFRVAVKKGSLSTASSQWSRRFMDAYDRGLNGRQAAWAARKYRGHRVLPQDILEELEKHSVS